MLMWIYTNVSETLEYMDAQIWTFNIDKINAVKSIICCLFSIIIFRSLFYYNIDIMNF